MRSFAGTGRSFPPLVYFSRISRPATSWGSLMPILLPRNTISLWSTLRFPAHRLRPTRLAYCYEHGKTWIHRRSLGCGEYRAFGDSSLVKPALWCWTSSAEDVRRVLEKKCGTVTSCISCSIIQEMGASRPGTMQCFTPVLGSRPKMRRLSTNGPRQSGSGSCRRLVIDRTTHQPWFGERIHEWYLLPRVGLMVSLGGIKSPRSECQIC